MLNVAILYEKPHGKRGICRFSWKLIKVSCQVLILAAVFRTLQSEQDLQVSREH